ncbi:Polyketide cyclase / dehydrase and lipid transport [Amycolatopsis xylanica]|uniref:Polyketide cyclase / dehydrase and lipid transport n=1 Tax=Amycolatopsis xylanica TaxID=589385 RepID=A0A1H3S9M4_9PSEU|nr:SRPBCC family protein [Amycolatopsis xylanica]SDZ34380.1 Polyketide cyclase / dehydrase and lipid transport [Amycolatopsis xylanica]
MTRVERTVPAKADDVFAVLADGWSYAAWVVGNSHVRDVDPEWPAVGSRLHHRTGAWPLQVQDITVVRAIEPGRYLGLEARLWVFGAACIELTLEPVPGGGTRVVMEERAISGPIKAIPHPALAAVLKPRNKEALARLADLATGRGTTLR